jgi:hypothetical protein
MSQTSKTSKMSKTLDGDVTYNVTMLAVNHLGIPGK